MYKITKYFYIFTKLITSISLLLVVFIMGYALFKSYKGINDEVSNIDIRFNSLSNLISKNNENYLLVNKKADKINEEILIIKNLLEKKQSSVNKLEYQKNIENLLSLNQDLQVQIDQINKDSDINFQNNNDKALDKDIKTIIEIVMMKYENGEGVKEEIILLEKIIPRNKNAIIEKLYLIESTKFFGLKNLENEFIYSSKKFVNTKFLIKDKNSILNFLFKFVTVRPNNLTIYQNNELNILLEAQGLIDKKDISGALAMIKKIDTNKEFFRKWISQADIYLDFKLNIERML